MTAPRLRKCPTCNRPLSDEDRRAMGLRTGEILNAMCPGWNGPSDIDHALHNGHCSPERLALMEYKRGNAPVSGGQDFLFRSVRGLWQNCADGRQLHIRTRVLDQFPSNPELILRPTVDWLWPGVQ